MIPLRHTALQNSAPKLPQQSNSTQQHHKSASQLQGASSTADLVKTQSQQEGSSQPPLIIKSFTPAQQRKRLVTTKASAIAKLTQPDTNTNTASAEQKQTPHFVQYMFPLVASGIGIANGSLSTMTGNDNTTVQKKKQQHASQQLMSQNMTDKNEEVVDITTIIHHHGYQSQLPSSSLENEIDFDKRFRSASSPPCTSTDDLAVTGEATGQHHHHVLPKRPKDTPASTVNTVQLSQLKLPVIRPSPSQQPQPHQHQQKPLLPQKPIEKDVTKSEPSSPTALHRSSHTPSFQGIRLTPTSPPLPLTPSARPSTNGSAPTKEKENFVVLGANVPVSIEEVVRSAEENGILLTTREDPIPVVGTTIKVDFEQPPEAHELHAFRPPSTTVAKNLRLRSDIIGYHAGYIKKRPISGLGTEVEDIDSLETMEDPGPQIQQPFPPAFGRPKPRPMTSDDKVQGPAVEGLDFNIVSFKTNEPLQAVRHKLPSSKSIDSRPHWNAGPGSRGGVLLQGEKLESLSEQKRNPTISENLGSSENEGASHQLQDLQSSGVFNRQEILLHHREKAKEIVRKQRELIHAKIAPMRLKTATTQVDRRDRNRSSNELSRDRFLSEHALFDRVSSQILTSREHIDKTHDKMKNMISTKPEKHVSKAPFVPPPVKKRPEKLSEPILYHVDVNVSKSTVKLKSGDDEEHVSLSSNDLLSKSAATSLASVINQSYSSMNDVGKQEITDKAASTNSLQSQIPSTAEIRVPKRVLVPKRQLVQAHQNDAEEEENKENNEPDDPDAVEKRFRFFQDFEILLQREAALFDDTTAQLDNVLTPIGSAATGYLSEGMFRDFVWNAFVHIRWMEDAPVSPETATKMYDMMVRSLTYSQRVEEIKSIIESLDRKEFVYIKALTGHISRITQAALENVSHGMAMAFGTAFFRQRCPETHEVYVSPQFQINKKIDEVVKTSPPSSNTQLAHSVSRGIRGISIQSMNGVSASPSVQTNMGGITRDDWSSLGLAPSEIMSRDVSFQRGNLTRDPSGAIQILQDGKEMLNVLEAGRTRKRFGRLSSTQGISSMNSAMGVSTIIEGSIPESVSLSSSLSSSAGAHGFTQIRINQQQQSLTQLQNINPNLQQQQPRGFTSSTATGGNGAPVVFNKRPGAGHGGGRRASLLVTTLLEPTPMEGASPTTPTVPLGPMVLPLPAQSSNSTEQPTNNSNNTPSTPAPTTAYTLTTLDIDPDMEFGWLDLTQLEFCDQIMSQGPMTPWSATLLIILESWHTLFSPPVQDDQAKNVPLLTTSRKGG